jgi:hypothetical protein
MAIGTFMGCSSIAAIITNSKKQKKKNWKDNETTYITRFIYYIDEW